MKTTSNLYLYVWRTGLVEYGSELPEGAILLASSNSLDDFARITVACQETLKDGFVISSVYRAWRAEQAETPKENRQVTALSRYPDDTPEEALDRWLAWRGLGPYSEAVS